MDTSSKIIQGREDPGLTTHCILLDVQKAYNTVWRKGFVEKAVGNGDQRKYVENDEKYNNMNGREVR